MMKKFLYLASLIKKNTNTLKNSISLDVINLLKKNNFVIFDPKLKLKKTIKNCYQEKNFEKFLNLNQNLLILTPWKYIKSNKIQKKYLILKSGL